MTPNQPILSPNPQNQVDSPPPSPAGEDGEDAPLNLTETKDEKSPDFPCDIVGISKLKSETEDDIVFTSPRDAKPDIDGKDKNEEDGKVKTEKDVKFKTENDVKEEKSRHRKHSSGDSDSHHTIGNKYTSLKEHKEHRKAQHQRKRFASQKAQHKRERQGKSGEKTKRKQRQRFRQTFFQRTSRLKSKSSRILVKTKFLIERKSCQETSAQLVIGPSLSKSSLASQQQSPLTTSSHWKEGVRCWRFNLGKDRRGVLPPSHSH